MLTLVSVAFCKCLKVRSAFIFMGESSDEYS